MPYKDAPTQLHEDPSPVPEMNSTAKSHRLLWFLAIPLLLGASGLVAWLSSTRTQKALAARTNASVAEPVTVMQPQLGSPTVELVMPATLQAYSEAPIFARTSGYISHWYADIGKHVREGELLAQIESPEVDQQLIRDRAALNQSQANLTLATVTTKRYQELIHSDSVAQQEVDQNNQNLASQQANVVSAAAAVKQLEQQQSYERVTAPFSGVVTERRTDVGDLINAGNSGTGAELFRVSRIDIMRIFVTVPEAYSQQITTGMHVSVVMTELPGQSFAGQVARTDHAIAIATRTLTVEVDVPNPQGKLLPGAYGEVHFKLPSATRPLIVPSGSLLFQSAGPQVAVVTGNSTVELHKVTIGRDFGNTTEITTGLSPLDRIIANPPDYLVDGMPVSVQNPPNLQPPATHTTPRTPGS
jgi:RND family efflux transporter MFP subunit